MPPEAPPRYLIQGRSVSFPVEVRDASSGSAMFLVPSAAARRLLACDAIDVAELLPGQALLSIAVIDYKDNDLGDYNEVSIALFVRPRGAGGLPWLGPLSELLRGRLGTHILHLPVDQSFTCEAGCSIWGFPKTVQEIPFHYETDRVSCSLVFDGEHALTLSLPRGGSRTLPESEMTTYTLVQGVPPRTRFRSRSEGVGMRLGGAELALGRGPIAEELRGLGLPKAPLFSTWMEKMVARFEPPEKL